MTLSCNSSPGNLCQSPAPWAGPAAVQGKEQSIKAGKQPIVEELEAGPWPMDQENGEGAGLVAGAQFFFPPAPAVKTIAGGREWELQLVLEARSGRALQLELDARSGQRALERRQQLKFKSLQRSSACRP